MEDDFRTDLGADLTRNSLSCCLDLSQTEPTYLLGTLA